MKKLKIKLAKKFTRLSKSPNFTTKNILIYMIGFALVGTLLVLISKAATPTANIQPESKTIASPAISGSDSSASGGGYVQFKKQTQTTGRQRVVAWVGTVNLDALLGNTAGGITLQTLKDNNISGVAVSLGAPHDSPIADWQIGEWRSARQYGTVNIGINVASSEARLPMTTAEIAPAITRWQKYANAAKAAGANGMAMDGEPYNLWGDNPDFNPWNLTTPTVMKSYGQQIGAIVKTVGDGTFIMYTSSNASWPGSYMDTLQLAAGNCPGQTSCYLNSKFADFVDGLVLGGAKVIFTDAAFHNAGGDIAGRTRDTVQRTKNRFPALQTSIMFWPDNDEAGNRKNGNWFTPAEVQAAVDAGTANSTGPMVIYQHHLTDKTIVPLWLQYLSAIKAGSQ